MAVFPIWRRSTGPVFLSKICFAPGPGDWLPEDHLADLVSGVVDQLDPRAIESVYEEEERGQPPYDENARFRSLMLFDF